MIMEQAQGRWPDALDWSDVSELARQARRVLDQVLALAAQQRGTVAQQAWQVQDLGCGANFKATLGKAAAAVMLDKEAGAPLVVFSMAGNHRMGRYFPGSRRAKPSFVSVETEGAIYALGAQEECFLELDPCQALVLLQPLQAHNVLTLRALGAA
jgi:hypothetical protein